MIELTQSAEKLRTPEFAKKAGMFLEAVEEATPDSPVSLERFLSNDTEHIVDILEHRLQRADALYERHSTTFFENGIAVDPQALDHEQILTLSNDIITEVKATQPLHWSVLLGLAVLQYAEAGVLVARDPSLFVVDPGNDVKEKLAIKASQLVDGTFCASFADRVSGDITKFPHPRLTYIGYLMEIHYDFWKERLKLMQIEAGGKGNLSPELTNNIQKLFGRFPAKTSLINRHALAGRPERQLMRQAYKESLEAFKLSLEQGVSGGKGSADNIYNAVKFLFAALDAALDRGYSPQEALQIAVINSHVIGSLTERVTDNLLQTHKHMMQFEGPRHQPRLVIDYPDVQYGSHLSDNTIKKIRRRDQKGGLCVGRRPIQLNRMRQTYKKLRIFSKAVEDRIGVYPPLFREVGDKIYVDPGALSVNFTLLAIADSYRYPAD